MHTAPVTVQQAIERGKKVVEKPSVLIMVAGPVLCALLMITYFSWGYLLMLPLALFCSFLYTKSATRRWCTWAYENVNDIHQFQRSAEIAGLLAPGSYQNASAEVQQRFAADAQFFDDPSIPSETVIYSTLMSSFQKPGMTISDKGIDIPSDRFFPWAEIENERIASVSYSRMSARTGEDISAGSANLFRFEYHDDRIEVPLSSIKIPTWKLDLLLYTYRCRYMLQQHAARTTYA